MLSCGILLSFVVSYNFQANLSLQGTEILMSQVRKSVVRYRNDKMLLSVSLAVHRSACLSIHFLYVVF